MDFNFGAAKLVNIAWSVLAGGMLAQAIAPSDPWLEKLGVLGIVVVGSYFLMKYFMDTLSKKDDLIRQMNEQNTTILVAAIREGHEAKTKIAESQNRTAEAQSQMAHAIEKLTDAINARQVLIREESESRSSKRNHTQ